jgi:hypothetical protein
MEILRDDVDYLGTSIPSVKKTWTNLAEAEETL